ncbi:MAG TPA: hypothetical protein VN906_14025 [Candidatus Sulfotelmatobacter sp.]|nr:hypothetical protein [Candidatus Sulfotelmatobacter sp.]
MPNFKRVSLVGSEDLFRATRPQVVTDTDDVIKEAVDRPGRVKEEIVYKTLNFTPEEIELLLEAVQVAKYPDRPRAKPALDKFDALDALRLKIHEAAG